MAAQEHGWKGLQKGGSSLLARPTDVDSQIACHTRNRRWGLAEKTTGVLLAD